MRLDDEYDVSRARALTLVRRCFFLNELLVFRVRMHDLCEKLLVVGRTNERKNERTLKKKERVRANEAAGTKPGLETRRGTKKKDTKG